MAVLTSREARNELGSRLSTFRAEGANAKPLIFGSHRKPEAVILPYSVFKQLAPLLEHLEIADMATKRIRHDAVIPLSDIAASLGLDPAKFD